jgi:hypothetical protein
MPASGKHFQSRIALIFACAIAAAFFPHAARAQWQAPGVSTGLIRVFDELKGFSAQAELRVLDNSGTVTTALPIHIGYAPGKLRLDFDITHLTNGLLPAFALESMSRIGLNQVATILVPERKNIVMLYPLFRAWTEMPMPPEELDAAHRKFTITRAELGRENIDARECLKTRATFTDADGRKAEATFWKTSDASATPVQIETRDKEGVVQFRFKWIRVANSIGKRFDAPDSYKKFSSSQELVKAAVAQAVAEQEREEAEKPEKTDGAAKAVKPAKPEK